MSCITTVTINPAIDEAVALDALNLGGKTRCTLDSLDPGGKGVNASRVIARLGRETVALGFAGGLTGDLLREKLTGEGIAHEFFDVMEATRVNIMIYERGNGRRSRLYLPGPHVTTTALRELELRLLGVPAQSVVVFGGSVPPGLPSTIYRDLMLALQPRGIKCIVDTSGEALLAALQARPALVKPNVEEAQEVLSRALLSEGDVLAAAREFLALGAQQVVISQGSQGAIGLNASGAWKAVPPDVTACSTVGSGDSMVAGLAIAMDEGSALSEGLRWGTAAGAATATVSGTQLCRADDVYELLPGVGVYELPSQAESVVA